MIMKMSDLRKLIAEEVVKLQESDIFIVRRGDKLFTVDGDIEKYYGPASKWDDLADGEVTQVQIGLGKEADKYRNSPEASEKWKKKGLFADY